MNKLAVPKNTFFYFLLTIHNNSQNDVFDAFDILNVEPMLQQQKQSQFHLIKLWQNIFHLKLRCKKKFEQSEGEYNEKKKTNTEAMEIKMKWTFMSTPCFYCIFMMYIVCLSMSIYMPNLCYILLAKKKTTRRRRIKKHTKRM